MRRAARTKYPWLPRSSYVSSEALAHPHVASERAELFQAFNAGTTELEVLNWLHSTIMVLKPNAVLETGAFDGVGTIALASACRNNGFGKVHSVEIDASRCEQIEAELSARGLREFAEIHCSDSLQFLASNDIVFDIGFFDSLCEIRAKECRECLDHGTIGRMAVFHDTSPTRCESLTSFPEEEVHRCYRSDIRTLSRDSRCCGIFQSDLSRGFICLFFDPKESASEWAIDRHAVCS